MPKVMEELRHISFVHDRPEADPRKGPSIDYYDDWIGLTETMELLAV
jgi:hypothetical protein